MFHFSVRGRTQSWQKDTRQSHVEEIVQDFSQDVRLLLLIVPFPSLPFPHSFPVVNRPSLSSHTASSLPLPEDAKRPRIDFLVFFVDMTNSKSLQNLQSYLLKVERDYFAQGRACVIANRGKSRPPPQKKKF